MQGACMDYLVRIVKLAPAFMLAISAHEFAHGLIAYWLGDDTAKRSGRLTLNPFIHLDFVGTLFILLVGVGWARPVPVDERNFSWPRLFSILVALAGPLANLIVALAGLYVIVGSAWLISDQALLMVIIELMQVVVWVNVMLAVFNLIPLPPLDGSHVIKAILPERWKMWYYLVAQYTFFFWIIILFLPGPSMLLMRAITQVNHWLHLLVF